MNQITCGIDWAEGHHDVALLDHEGQLLARRRIVESVEGFAELITLLAEVGDSTEDPIPVAIETPRGLLVAALRATGRPVYAINPSMWRGITASMRSSRSCWGRCRPGPSA